MAVSVSGSGTYTMTNAEAVVHTEPAAGVYELHVDLSSMDAGDTVVFRAKEKILSNGTVRAVSYLTASGAQSDIAATGEYTGLIRRLGPIVSDVGVVVTAIQSAIGVYRAIPWKLVRIA